MQCVAGSVVVVGETLICSVWLLSREGGVLVFVLGETHVCSMWLAFQNSIDR